MIAKTRSIKVPKSINKEQPSVIYNDPEFVYIAISNARCPSGEVSIQVGDHVTIGQQIGIRHASFFDQPIHSSVSGEFVGIEKHTYRSNKKIDFIKIKNDHKNEFTSNKIERSDEEILALNKDEISKIIKDKSLVGLGGSSFPTFVKFDTKTPIDTILINGIECEPLITSDYHIMLDHSQEIMEGIKYTMHAFNAKRVILCFKKKHQDLVDYYLHLIGEYPDIPLELKFIKNYYPAGWEVSMIHDALKINVKPGELPSKYGVINFNVSTIIGVYNALKFNMPVYERLVSVSGDGIKTPQNFLIRVGTPFQDLLKLCGGYVDDKPKVIIVGGPMMGSSLSSDDLIFSKTVTSVIVLNQRVYKEEPCIRCGSCGYSCSVGLMPMQIMNAVKSLDKEKLKVLHVNQCIECGLCGYTCTSKIDLVSYMKTGKILAK